MGTEARHPCDDIFHRGTNPCSSDDLVGVLLGNGNGTFQAAVTYSSGGYAAESIAVHDVNGMASRTCSCQTSAPATATVQTAVGLGCC